MRRLALIAALGTALALPAPAGATATIGSNLGRVPVATTVCPGGCTNAIADLPAGSTAAGGVVSPVNGLVTAWRVRVGPETDQLAFRVIRPIGPTLISGAGSSAPVTPGEDAINAFAVQLPISIGDHIGYTRAGALASFTITGGGTGWGWTADVPDNGPGQPIQFVNTTEHLINADVEPTAEFRIGKVKKLANGKIKVRLDLPNPGTVIAGDSKKAARGSVATVAAKRRLNTRRVTADDAGHTSVVLKPTKSIRKRFKGGGRARVKTTLRIGFTPLFGDSTAVESKKTQLRG